MISFFRKLAKSPLAMALLVLVALGLLVTGGQQFDVLGQLSPRHVISAGDRSVDASEFRADFDRVRERLQQQAQRPVSVEDMINENLHLRYLDSESKKLGFLNWAWSAGVRPGKELVLKQIRQIPQFFDSVTGRFSEETYRQVLAEQNITPVMLEQEFRDQYTLGHFGAGLGAGARLPRVYGALIANQALESRDARWFVVTRAMAGAAPAPTDAQLNTFMQQNAARLRRPETRSASLVLFNDGTASAPVTEEDIQKRFDFRKDALSQPEKRTFVTLTAPNKAAADRIAAALRAGKTPAEAGRANGGVQPSDYASSPRTVLSDPGVAAAVFGLGVDQVSDPVQGRVGFTVAKVTAITPARPVTLPEVRDQIVDELRAEAARARTFERVEAYEAARKAGKTLEQAAEAAGARIMPLPHFTQDGRRADGQPLNAPQPILEQAWKLAKGGESDVIDLGQGQYFAMRLTDIVPAALPTLAEVRGPLTQAWTQRENARLMTVRANALEARVRGGEDIAAVARSVNAPLVTRASMQQTQTVQQEVGQEVTQAVFNVGRGEVFSAPGGEDSLVVGRVDRISAAVPALAAPVGQQVRERLSQQISQALGEQALIAAADRSKATYDVGRAREALGLPAEPETPAPGAPAPAAPAR
jgi:peptidyl-prolyl cis-trans isomerase D